MTRAAGVKKSPYQNSAQMHAQSAKAKTFASRKKITPRRLGMGSTYCFASATGAEPNGGAAAQSTTATHPQSLSCSVCLRGSSSASTKPDRLSDAEKRERM